MKTSRIMHGERGRQLSALIAVLLALAGIVIGLSSCGTDDLSFPGQPGPTPTSRFTVTPDETPEDEDDGI